jgi:two-component system phosphate regulon response regulator PhoB
MARILVIDGSAADRELVCAQLRAEGHETLAAQNGEEGLALLRRESPMLVISDWSLPDMDGHDLLLGIRACNGQGLAPVMMLAARASADSISSARAAGVADIMFKPHRKDELVARVAAALRGDGASIARHSLLSNGKLRLDRVAHKVKVGQFEIDLAPVEFRLLAFLMENPGRVLDRQQLLEKVWNRRAGIGQRTVDVHVRRLRAALEPHGCDGLLQTVRGFGYRFG